MQTQDRRGDEPIPGKKNKNKKTKQTKVKKSDHTFQECGF
jgi:hypothetical protein